MKQDGRKRHWMPRAIQLQTCPVPLVGSATFLASRVVSVCRQGAKMTRGVLLLAQKLGRLVLGAKESGLVQIVALWQSHLVLKAWPLARLVL